MKRKLTVIALTLALIVTMMPIYTGVAFADEGSEVLTFYNTGASSGSVPINSSGLDSGQVVYGTITSEGKVSTGITTTGAIADIPDNDWNWAVEENTTPSEGAYTLVLKDFNVTGSALTYGVLYIATSCAIELRGESSIANTSGSAIYSESANMYFKGQGGLTATGGVGSDMVSSYGIGSWSGSITISSGTITAKGGESLQNSYGIFSHEGKINISGGRVNAQGQDANGYSMGIFAENGNCNIAISNATVSAISGYAKGGDSFGICSQKDINISNSHVDAKSGESLNSCSSNGIHAYSTTGGITISNSTVNAEGGKGGTDSSGINSAGNLTIDNRCEVTATGGAMTTNGDSYGIYAGNQFNSRGTVHATGGTATSGKSFGIYSAGLVRIGSNGIVYAQGQSAQDESAGLYAGGVIQLYEETSRITATGGAVTAAGGCSYGIYTMRSISSESTIHATGGNSSGRSFGIFSQTGSITISGGAVTATAGNAQYYSCGIYAESSILGYNSTINAKGDEGYEISSGIYSNNGMVFIDSGCAATATGGAVTESGGNSYGIYADEAVYGVGTIHATGGTSSGSSFGIHSRNREIEINGGSGSATASTASSSSQAFNVAPTLAAITTSNGAWDSHTMTWGGASTPPTPSTPPSSGGSPAPSSSPEPSITTDSNGDSANDVAGGTAIFDKINKKVVITPADGFEVADVTVNGVSKGKVTELTGLLSSDKVVVTFAKSKTPEQIEAEKQAKISAGVKATRIIYPTAVRQKNGKVKLTWQKSYGFKVDYYIIYRSAKKNSGFTKVFTSKTMRYITAKNLKAGKNIYFKVIGVRKVGDNLVKTEISRVEAINIK